MRDTLLKRLFRLPRRLSCAVLLLLGTPLMAAPQGHQDDPWEAFNRPVFAFNETLDTYALKPLAQGYQKVTPQPLEDGIHNMFSNLGELVRLGNNLLQGKLHAAGVDTSRLLFNSTFGVLGFFDVATPMGLLRSDEDFGQTLGAWGLGSGPYLVLPFAGPSNPRDALGMLVDNRARIYPQLDHVPTRNTALGMSVIDTRANLLSAERMIIGDKYVFVRNAYLQNREFRVRDGQVEDDFDDF